MQKTDRAYGSLSAGETTPLQLIRSSVRYAHAHRSELPGNVVVAVFRAREKPTRAALGTETESATRDACDNGAGQIKDDVSFARRSNDHSHHRLRTRAHDGG